MTENFETLLLKEIGNVFKKMRTNRQMTQDELSQDICDRVTITKLESGQIKAPNVIVLNQIAKKLGVEFSSVLALAENSINNCAQMIKKRILLLIANGKYEEAQKYALKNMKPQENEIDFKYYCYIKGSSEFYSGHYHQSRNTFASALNNFKDLKKDSIIELIDILILNGFIASEANLKSAIAIHHLYVLKNSVDYYMFFETEHMVRISIYLVDYFRLVGYYSICENLIADTESIIDLYCFFELKVELNIQKIFVYLQTGKYLLVESVIEKIRSVLLSHGLEELNEYFNKKLEDICDAWNSIDIQPTIKN